MTALTVESDREREMAQELRSLAVQRIKSLGVESAAQALGMAATGVQSLLWHQVWRIETAFRVADALDLDLLRSWQDDMRQARLSGSNGNGHHDDA